MKIKYLLPVLISLPMVGANAALILEDHFSTTGSYTVGALGGQGPTISGTTGNWLNGTSIQVSATGLDYSDANYLPESGGSVNRIGRSDGRQGRVLSTAYTNSSVGTVYLSFLMQTGTASSTGYRALELHDGDIAAAGDATRKFQLGFHDGDLASGGANYGFRLLNNNGVGFKSALGANNSLVNLFVVKFDFSSVANSDQVTVWQNPDLTSLGDPTGGIVKSGFDMSFDTITFASFGPLDQVQWDEVRLGDTFADVTVVPEPSSAALLGLAGLALLARRRR